MSERRRLEARIYPQGHSYEKFFGNVNVFEGPNSISIVGYRLWFLIVSYHSIILMLTCNCTWSGQDK